MSDLVTEIDRLNANPVITVLSTQEISIEGGRDGWIVTATFDPADRWNGWIGHPKVDRANADVIIANSAPEGGEGSLYWEGENGESDVLAYVNEDGVEHIHPDENGLYDVGLGWVWFECDRLPGAEDIEAAIARAKTEILEDVKSGRVPADVRDFAHLHDFVDANTYGGLCDGDDTHIAWASEQGIEAGNTVQSTVSGWIAEGGIAAALPPAFTDHDLRIAKKIVDAIKADSDFDSSDPYEFAEDAVDLWAEDGGYSQKDWPKGVTQALYGVRNEADQQRTIAAIKHLAPKPVEDRIALVFTIDVTGLSPEARAEIEAAVSAQLDDVAEYESSTVDHDTERPILGAVQVGLDH